MAESNETGSTPQGEKAASEGPAWPSIATDSPLARFIEEHAALIKEAEYDEVFGIHLSTATAFHRNLILQKFLRANADDVEKAKEQLLSTLKWRKAYNPLAAKDEVFSEKRFGGLGYIYTVKGAPGSLNEQDVISFNIYGAVKDNKETFGDLDGFLRWRVGLMELSLAELKLSKATEPIPNYGEGEDRYRCMQVHDYLDISFLRQDPDSKAAANKAIETFKNYYPETLSRKFFVNVPGIMGWMFTAAKLVLSKETVRKFTVLSYGKDLALEVGPDVPPVYGGQGTELDTALTLKME